MVILFTVILRCGVLVLKVFCSQLNYSGNGQNEPNYLERLSVEHFLLH